MNRLPQRIQGIDERHRLLLAGALGLLAGGFSFGAPLPILLIHAWNGFALGMTFLAWLHIFTDRSVRSFKQAKMQDYGRTVVFIAVLGAACVSLFAVGYLLVSSEKHGDKAVASYVGTAILTVLNGWFLIHTLFTLRYAHFFHDDNEATGGRLGGVQFPDDENPDYLDFAYFAFIIGMTAQTADVNITGKDVRRLALVHGLVSFLFNTAILALGINVVSGLLAP